MAKAHYALSLIVLGLLLLVAAPTAAQDESSSAPLQVVATTTIIADVARNIGGELVEVTALIPPEADVHGFQLTPRDVAGIAEADLVLVNGVFLEEGLLDVVEVNATGEIVVVSEGVAILPFEGHGHDHAHDEHGDDEHGDDDHGDEEHGDDDHGDDDHGDEEHGDDDHGDEEHGDDDHAHEGDDHADSHIGVQGDSLDCDVAGMAMDDEHHDDEHSDDDHADEAHDHDHGPCDPHVWTDPQNVMQWASNIADAFAAADPAHAEVYAASAEAYIAELEALDAELREMVEMIPAEERVIVTNHGFLAYFAYHYDFEVVGTVIPAATTAAEAAPQSLAELVEIIEAEDVRAIFAEISDTTDLAETIAAEVGESVQVLTLYSGSLSNADGPAATYIDYMRHNTEIITGGLAG